MAANMITLGRILLVFFVVAVFQLGFFWRLAAVLLTIIVLYMDSLDGYVARKLGVASDFGAIFDITGDRIVEHIYLIFFSAMGVLSFWVPVIFVTRSFLADTMRSVAYAREGKTPFGEKTMMKSAFTRFLTSSRFSRAVYGASKLVVFVLLGLILALQKGYEEGYEWVSYSSFQKGIVVTGVIVWITVVFNIVRGVPVLWDGRFYLFEKYLPKELRNEG
jgi:CDP-diacylglycerol--glycerol-3-phosphate 3-phosphatidyltransferase